MLCWLSEKKLAPNGKYALKHTTRDVRCVVKTVQYKLNINTMERLDNHDVGLNDIARVSPAHDPALSFSTHTAETVLPEA